MANRGGVRTYNHGFGGPEPLYRVPDLLSEERFIRYMKSTYGVTVKFVDDEENYDPELAVNDPEQTVDEQPVNEDTTNEDTVNEDTSNEDTSNEDSTVNEDTTSEDTTSEDDTGKENPVLFE